MAYATKGSVGPGKKKNKKNESGNSRAEKSNSFIRNGSSKAWGDTVKIPKKSFRQYKGKGDTESGYNRKLTDSLSAKGLPTGNFDARVHDASSRMKSQGNKAGAKKLSKMGSDAKNYNFGNQPSQRVFGAKNSLERTLMSIEGQRKKKKN